MVFRNTTDYVGYAHWTAAAARSVPAGANSLNVRKTAKKPA
jgi:hypothetical protein